MTQTLQGAVERIQKLANGLSGMKAAPDYPPEKMAAFPYAVSYVGSFDATSQSANWEIVLATIITEIHVQRKDLPKDAQVAVPYGDSFRQAVLDDPTLDDKVTTVRTVRGTFGPLDWGEMQTLGWLMETDVKLTNTI